MDMGKDELHMDQDLEMVVDMEEEDGCCQGTYMGLDNGMEVKTQNCPLIIQYRLEFSVLTTHP